MNCRVCGCDIDTEKRRKDGTVVCPECGAIYIFKSKSAQTCSSDVMSDLHHRKNAPSKKSNHSKRRKKRRRNAGILVPLVLLAVAVLALVIIFAQGSEPDKAREVLVQRPTEIPADSPPDPGDGIFEPPVTPTASPAPAIIGYAQIVNCEAWTSMRESPSITSARVTQAPLGATVSLYELIGTQWFHCAYEGAAGYIQAEYLFIASN